MTFRIFSDDARKAIADHIIGAPPAIPNRYGENHGTDLLVQAGDRQPPQYNPKVTGLYLPQGSYAPGQPSSQDTPPSHTPGQTAQIECSGGVPADHSGKCPESMFEKNGKLFAFTRQVDSNGLAYCCPTEIPSLNRSDQQVPESVPTQSPCGPLSTPGDVAVFKVSEMGVQKNEPPFNGKTPAEYVFSKEIDCQEQEGFFKTIDTKKNGILYRTVSCCKTNLLDSGQVVPPAKTPTPPPTETKDYDGDDKNSMPEGPDAGQIVFRARPLQDIAGGNMGYCQVDIDIIGVNQNNCKNIIREIHTTAKSTDSLATDCSKTESYQRLVFCRNPGSSTIERGTPVIAVKDFTANNSGITTATIVVVPCST